MQYRKFLLPDTDDVVVSEALNLVKAADCFPLTLSASTSRRSVTANLSAKVEVGERLDAFRLPEVDWFKENALPAYAKSLDEINFDFNLK